MTDFVIRTFGCPCNNTLLLSTGPSSVIFHRQNRHNLRLNLPGHSDGSVKTWFFGNLVVQNACRTGAQKNLAGSPQIALRSLNARRTIAFQYMIDLFSHNLKIQMRRKNNFLIMDGDRLTRANQTKSKTNFTTCRKLINKH